MNPAVLKYLDLYYELMWVQLMEPGNTAREDKVLDDLDRVWHLDMGTDAPGYAEMRADAVAIILKRERIDAIAKLRRRGHTFMWAIEDAGAKITTECVDHPPKNP